MLLINSTSLVNSVGNVLTSGTGVPAFRLHVFPFVPVQSWNRYRAVVTPALSAVLPVCGGWTTVTGGRQ